MYVCLSVCLLLVILFFSFSFSLLFFYDFSPELGMLCHIYLKIDLGTIRKKKREQQRHQGTTSVSDTMDNSEFIDSRDIVGSLSTGGSLVSSLITFMWRGGTVLAGIVSIMVGLLYVKQDNLLYFPEIGGMSRRPSKNPRLYRSPQEHHIPYETNMIRCDDGVSIHSWLLLHPDSLKERKPTLIFFHGNAGNIGLRLPNAVQMYQHLNANILMVEYRGFGDSDDAKPNESGLKLDAEAALRFISTYPMVDPNRLFLFGRSLGGAVVFHLAQYAERIELPLAGVIVENTFLSISQMVDHLMPALAPFKALVLRIGWYSSRIVPHLKIPTLYLAGANDTLVPHSHMLQLYQASSKNEGSCARIHVVKGGTHNETWLQGGRHYWDAIRSFLREVFDAEKDDQHHSSISMEDMSMIGGGSTSANRRTAVSLETEKEQSKSSIPLMPSNIVGIAREAISKKKE